MIKKNVTFFTRVCFIVTLGLSFFSLACAREMRPKSGAIRHAIEACFSRKNAEGGIQGKTLRLVGLEDFGIANDTEITVLYEAETIWLSQKNMAALFGVTVNTISEHLQNIFASEELVKEMVTKIYRATAVDNKRYATQFYNLDVIIAVGYRVNSKQATDFRIWVTKIVRELVIKGFYYTLWEGGFKRG